ncbi:MAG: hypothetical protein Phog2KO_19780 [Phototrophicaceae bacterium]
MLEIKTNLIDNIIILDISGRIDALNSTRLQNQIDATIDSSKLLVLRMADVNYISAAGLRVLRSLQQDTGQVRIIEPSDRVVEVMEMTGLDAVYKLYNSVDDIVI